jgi:hypothetical protein
VVGGDRRSLRELDGTVIQRVIWSPKPFPGDNDSGDHPP